MPSITIDGSSHEAQTGERLIDVINRCGKELPQVCYHPQLGPIQTCDTCIVEVDGKLTRACGTTVSGVVNVLTKSASADRAQREAFDRIFGNHLLYCTVCDNNNGNCTVHNTTALLKVEHQNIPFKNKPYEGMAEIAVQSHTPAYKETAVKMRVLDEVKESPLPRINHRFGTPTPQRGVEVERKWKRPEYRMPGTNGQTKNSWVMLASSLLPLLVGGHCAVKAPVRAS